MADGHKKSFWSTLPGILTGAAALITAITGSIALYYSIHPISGGDKKPDGSGGRVDYMSRFVGTWLNENIHTRSYFKTLRKTIMKQAILKKAS